MGSETIAERKPLDLAATAAYCQFTRGNIFLRFEQFTFIYNALYLHMRCFISYITCRIFGRIFRRGDEGYYRKIDGSDTPGIGRTHVLAGPARADDHGQ